MPVLLDEERQRLRDLLWSQSHRRMQMRSMRGKATGSGNDSDCICSCKRYPGVHVWRAGGAQMGAWITTALLGYDACEVAAVSGSVQGTVPPAQMIRPRRSRCRVSCALCRPRQTARLLGPGHQ